jgi:hypothetical protein
MRKAVITFTIVFTAILFQGCGQSIDEVREKWLTAMKDVKSIGYAIESLMTDTYEAPQVDGIEKIKNTLQPKHIKELPLKDPWGNPYIYKYDRDDKLGYYIICTGTDGKVVEGSNDDIVYSNGEFIVYPKI